MRESNAASNGIAVASSPGPLPGAEETTDVQESDAGKNRIKIGERVILEVNCKPHFSCQQRISQTVLIHSFVLPNFHDNSILEVCLTKSLQYVTIHNNHTKKPVTISSRSWGNEKGPQVPKVPTVPKGPKGTKGPLGTVVEWPRGSIGTLGAPE
jgi:hypothetical protein